MPELVVLLGDQVVNKYVFDKDVISVGRARDNDVVIENLAVSRNHCRIRRKNDGFFLTDLNSANGTEVNGVAVTKTELQHDDVVAIGKHRILFKNQPMSDEALISDAFGAERTMIVDQAPVAYLVITRGKQKDLEFRVDKAEVSIGRGTDCDLCLHDWFVSKKHAVIHRQGGSFLLRDAGSWRGTKVNETQITETVLKDGDEIQLGGTRVTFRLAADEELKRPTGRIPLELGPSDSVLSPVGRGRPKRGIEEAGNEWDEPIRAGGEEDFIQPSARARRSADEPAGDFDDLEAELRDGAEMIRDVITTPVPPEIVEELAAQAEANFEAEPRLSEVETGSDDLGHTIEAVFGADEPRMEEEAAAMETAPEEEPERPPARPGGIIIEAPLGYREAPVKAETPPEADEEVEPPEEEVEQEPEQEPVELESQAEEEPFVEPEPIAEDRSADPREREVLLWEDALKNKSPIIRKQAARMLKRLTGRDYDY